MPESRNLIEDYIAEQNRDPTNERLGGYTFNAFPPDDYEGIIFIVAALRLGDHAHLEWSSGRQVPVPNGRQPALNYGRAGRIILAWDDWLALRPTLDADERFRIAEVERPSQGQLDRHIDRPASMGRERLAEAIRDWIHEQPFSECSVSADECPDWPRAYELADRILSTDKEQSHGDDKTG